MKAWLIAGVLVILALDLSPWKTRTVVEGEVTGKREAFEMTGGDQSRHVYEVSYRFRSAGSLYPRPGKDSVDSSLYHRLQIGSRTPVSYAPQRFFGVPMGLESRLSESSALSRIPFASGFTRETVELVAAIVTAWLGFLAYRRKSTPLGMVAGFFGGIWFSAVLMAGFLIFPVLFWLWRVNREKGYGWLLLGTMASTTAVLYWRIPQPTPMPSGPTREAAGVIRHLKVVDQLWRTDEGGGQSIRLPFEMVDIEFTPGGASEPIHILDRVDRGSVPGLSEGASVRVVYPVSAPGNGRLAGGTRTYAEDALRYVLSVTFGLSALAAFVFWPMLFLAEKVRGKYLGLMKGIPVDEVARKVSEFPADDPRRRALEAFLRSRRND